MLKIEKTFVDNEHYREIMGEDGDAFVRALQWLFTDEASEYNLSGELTMPQFMSCVWEMINATGGNQAKQSIRDIVHKMNTRNDDKPLEFTPTHFSEADIFYSFKSVPNTFCVAVVWSTYLYWLFQASKEGCSKNAENAHTLTKDFFLEMIDDISLANHPNKDPEKMRSSNPLYYQTESMLLLMISGTPTKAAIKEYKQKLKYYRDDPVYGQCYEGIHKVVGYAGRKNKIETSYKDCVDIFEEAEHYVNTVLGAEFPEIEIGRIHSHIIDKYSKKKPGHDWADAKSLKHIGSTVEMVFVIALWDKMEIKSKYVMNEFYSCRQYWVNANYPLTCADRSLWKLIAERIKDTKQPLIEDLEIKISELESMIHELNEEMKKKNVEIKSLKDGIIMEDGNFKTTHTGKRIAILHYLLDMAIPLVEEDRIKFKNLCFLMTGANDGTLERLLSQGQLNIQKDSLKGYLEEYPILKKHEINKQQSPSSED